MYVEAPLAVIVVELPAQIVGEAADAVTVGVGVTVTATVFAPLLQPAVVPVTVYVVLVPGVTLMLEPVKPPGCHVYVVAPVTVSVVELPEHIFTGPDGVIVGLGFTVTTIVWAAPVHAPFVPVTVYVVVEPGDTLTVDVVAPIAGDHVYVPAPVADITVDEPEQIVGGGDVIVTVGVVVTETTTVLEPVHARPAVVPTTE